MGFHFIIKMQLYNDLENDLGHSLQQQSCVKNNGKI
jgi:hypothetical protein